MLCHYDAYNVSIMHVLWTYVYYTHIYIYHTYTYIMHISCVCVHTLRYVSVNIPTLRLIATAPQKETKQTANKFIFPFFSLVN